MARATEEVEGRHPDGAFMGSTHALSAAALYLALVAFIPQHFLKLFQTDNMWVVITAGVVVAGASLIPDLDNTASTSKSSLGLLGDVLSLFFRGTSSFIQMTVRTQRDDSTPNPHRGFYHTIPACLLLGAFCYLLTQLNFVSFSLPKLGEVTLGAFFALVIVWLNIHMALAGLAKKAMKSLKKQAGIFGELVAFGLSLLFAMGLFSLIPKDISFWWIGVSVALGCLIHIFGDCFTTAGNPIYFPFKHKGKRWWTTRFLPIHAGGTVENVIFTPFFLLVIAVSLIRIGSSL